MNTDLSAVWEQLAGRLEGPLFLRFLLQPTVAAILAVRAGIADARAGRSPYFWTLLSHPEERRQLIRAGWKDVSKVFFIAVILDTAYQLIVFHFVYVIQSITVAFVLAVVPYVLVRGPATRIASRLQKGG